MFRRNRYPQLTQLPGPAIKTLSIKVPDSLFTKLASAADARKVSKSEMVRARRVGKPAPKNASLWTRMEDLATRADSLSADLSLNKVRRRHALTRVTQCNPVSGQSLRGRIRPALIRICAGLEVLKDLGLQERPRGFTHVECK